MSSGNRWQDYVDVAIACPTQWPFGTKVTVDGKTWTCLDRGGAINCDSGVCWIDQLTANPQYAFGSIVEAQIVFP